MALFRVQVGVALARPPRTDEYRLVVVDADNGHEAKLIAAQIAACTSVMPVSTLLLGHPDPFPTSTTRM